MGLSYDSVRWNIQLLPLLKSNKMSKKVKQEILDVIETELEKDHIEALLTESSEAFPAAKLNFRMGRILYDEADVSSATQYFNRALDLTQDGFEKEKIQEFIIQMNKTYLTQKHVIGCVLPLTGKYEDYGQKSLRAIQYALGFFNKEEKKSKDLLGTPSYELAIYDSQGDIQEATKGVETLLEKHGVIAIIGPLLSSTSEQAALRAQQLQVPLINLSQHPTLNEIGDFVFRISMTKDQQTDALVKYACEQKQLKKYAILYPEDSYGIEFANQFWTKIEACGGQVVGIEAYKPRQSSFNNEIKKLVGLFYPRARKYEYRLIEEQLKMEQNREEIQEKEIKLSPIIDFEAVFIPDYARTIGQVAPSLAYYDIENVTLLGTQGWNSKDLIKRGTEYVKDAVFVDGFFADSLQAQSQAFVKGFERIFGEEPQIWEAQAFDAAELLLTFLEKEEMQSRIQLKTELLALSEVTGVTGRMDFSDHNQIKKDLFLLTVKNNAIVALEELGPVPEM
jgi:branched-chain amino acid transport system substrate-binding protein